MTYPQMSDEQKKAIEPWVAEDADYIFNSTRMITREEARMMSEDHYAKFLTAFLEACPKAWAHERLEGGLDVVTLREPTALFNVPVRIVEEQK